MDFQNLYFDKREVGKTIKSTKVYYLWEFLLLGKPHKVEMFHSIVSGKKKLCLDAQVLTEDKSYSANFNYSFRLESHYFNLIQMSNDTFDLRIDNKQFATLSHEIRHQRGGRGSIVNNKNPEESVTYNQKNLNNYNIMSFPSNLKSSVKNDFDEKGFEFDNSKTQQKAKPSIASISTKPVNSKVNTVNTVNTKNQPPQKKQSEFDFGFSSDDPQKSSNNNDAYEKNQKLINNLNFDLGVLKDDNKPSTNFEDLDFVFGGSNMNNNNSNMNNNANNSNTNIVVNESQRNQQFTNNNINQYPGQDEFSHYDNTNNIPSNNNNNTDFPNTDIAHNQSNLYPRLSEMNVSNYNDKSAFNDFNNNFNNEFTNNDFSNNDFGFNNPNNQSVLNNNANNLDFSISNNNNVNNNNNFNNNPQFNNDMNKDNNKKRIIVDSKLVNLDNLVPNSYNNKANNIDFSSGKLDLYGNQPTTNNKEYDFGQVFGNSNFNPNVGNNNQQMNNDYGYNYSNSQNVNLGYNSNQNSNFNFNNDYNMSNNMNSNMNNNMNYGYGNQNNNFNNMKQNQRKSTPFDL